MSNLIILQVSCRRTDLYAFKDVGREDVEAGVDFVGHELLRLLHEALDAPVALFIDHHTVFARLVHFGDLCATFVRDVSKSI